MVCRLYCKGFLSIELDCMSVYLIMILFSSLVYSENRICLFTKPHGTPYNRLSMSNFLNCLIGSVPIYHRPLTIKGVNKEVWNDVLYQCHLQVKQHEDIHLILSLMK